MIHGSCAVAGVVVLCLLLTPFAPANAANPVPPGGSCPYCDLRGADLSGQDLTGVNLVGADLSGANFKNARLHGAMLAGANLTHAQLDGADLTTGVHLLNANLTSASLVNAKLRGANFQYAEMTGADFTGAEKREAHFGPDLDLAGGAPQETRYYCGAFDASRFSNVIFVAASGADTATCGGAMVSSCKTIGQGITNCNGPNCIVLVAYGRYTPAATIALRNGVSVYGGCAMLPAPNPAYVSLVTAPPNGVPAFSATGLQSPITLQGFGIFATPGTASSTPSIAMRASGTSALTLSYLTIAAANGATPSSGGGDGANGNNGANAGAPPQQGTNNACADTNGGGGGTESLWPSSSGGCALSIGGPGSGGPGSTGWSAKGGAGTPQSYYDFYCSATPLLPQGGAGDPGRSGHCGSQATQSPNTAGAIANGVWEPSVSGNGGDGGSGGGGGGGASGAGCCYSCWGVRRAYAGMPGGGGGAGGCAGTGGKGGTQGGASMALFVTGGTVSIINSIVTGATGGTGSKGGRGGRGGSGGTGASSPGATVCYDKGSTGGTGGHGGNGGSGAGGAGGNGGPAFCIAKTSGSNVSVDAATILYTGTGGSGGEGGQGGSNTGDPCNAPTGLTGSKGLNETQHTY